MAAEETKDAVPHHVVLQQLTGHAGHKHLAEEQQKWLLKDFETLNAMKNTTARDKVFELKDVIREVLEAKHQHHLLMSGKVQDDSGTSKNAAQFDKLKARRGSMSAMETYKQLEAKMAEEKAAAQKKADEMRKQVQRMLQQSPRLRELVLAKSGAEPVQLKADELRELVGKVKTSDMVLKAEIAQQVKTKEELLMMQESKKAAVDDLDDLAQRTGVISARAKALQRELEEAKRESKKLTQELHGHDSVQRALHEQFQAQKDSSQQKQQDALQPQAMFDTLTPASLVSFYSDMMMGHS